MADSMSNDIADYVRLFEASEDASYDARALAEKSRDYYDSKQWTDEEVLTLRKRKQAPITINRVKPKIDYMLGVERQSRTDPKALPRTPEHEHDTEAATSALRYVDDNNEFDTMRSEVWENLLIEGVGGIDVGVEPKGDSFEIVYKRYNFDRIFYDPHSRARDFSDASYLGGVVWMDVDEAKAMFPDHDDELEAMCSSAAESDTYDDTPRYRWSDPKRRRVRVCLVYRKDPKGGWVYAWYTKSTFLRGPAESPYLDYDTEETACPLILTSAYVDRDGQRYGYVRQMLDPQDEYNKRRSRSLHLMNQRQTFGNQQSGVEAKQVKSELSKADGHVDMQSGEWGKDFGIIPTQDMSAGNLRILDLARQELDSVGPSESIAGRGESTQSGKAIIATQQGAQVEIGPLLDGLRNWQRRVYRATWNRIRQYWDGETWIRITDDKQNLKFVGLNTTDDQGQPVNQISELDVDIILEDVPDTANVQSEMFSMFTDAVRASGQQVPLPLWLELMPGFPNKEKVLEMIQGSPEEQQQKSQEQQALQALQMRGVEADIENKEADAQAKQMKAMEDRMDAMSRQFDMMMKARQSGVEFDKARAEAEGQAAQVGKTQAETEKVAAETAKIVIDTLIAQGVIADPAQERSVSVNA